MHRNNKTPQIGISGEFLFPIEGNCIILSNLYLRPKYEFFIEGGSEK